ncbi:MAG: DUF4160 domain-containing protein [Bdellovibrionota bacterium]
MGPYRFYFFSREEPRPHVHVQSADGEAKFWIEPDIELVKNQGLNDRELGRILSVIAERREEIRNAWRRHFDR